MIVRLPDLLRMEGKSLRFKVSCRDEVGLIGDGAHRRAMIELHRFAQRLEAKAAGQS